MGLVHKKPVITHVVLEISTLNGNGKFSIIVTRTRHSILWIESMWDFKLSPRLLWRVLSSGMLCLFTCQETIHFFLSKLHPPKIFYKFNVFLPHTPKSPKYFLPFCYRTIVLYTFLKNHMHVTCHAQVILLNLITVIIIINWLR